MPIYALYHQVACRTAN